jgi:hypothetical protein
MNYLYIQLLLTGVVIMLVAAPALNASDSKDPEWLKGLVVGLFLGALGLIVGGALAAIWTFQP